MEQPGFFNDVADLRFAEYSLKVVEEDAEFMDYFSRSSSWDVTDVPRPLRSIARRGHGFEPWIWMSGLGYT